MSKKPGSDLKPGEPSATEEDLRRLFRLSLDLMCVAGLDGYFKKVNPAFEKVLGYDRKELLDRQFIEFVHPDDQEATLNEVANLAEGAMTIDFENRYRTHSGDYRWLAWRSAPDVESGLIYAVARDITEQKRNQVLLESRTEELARSNADLEQFAYVASHDLRAPLRSIVTLAKFIEDDLGDEIPEQTRAHLIELGRRTLLMKALIDDLLVYAQAGRVSEEIVEVDAARLVRSIAFMLDTPEGFEISFEGEVPIFETFRGPLEQVLRNLIRQRGQAPRPRRGSDCHHSTRPGGLLGTGGPRRRTGYDRRGLRPHLRCRSRTRKSPRSAGLRNGVADRATHRRRLRRRSEDRPRGGSWNHFSFHLAEKDAGELPDSLNCPR